LREVNGIHWRVLNGFGLAVRRGRQHLEERDAWPPRAQMLDEQGRETCRCSRVHLADAVKDPSEFDRVARQPLERQLGEARGKRAVDFPIDITVGDQKSAEARFDKKMPIRLRPAAMSKQPSQGRPHGGYLAQGRQAKRHRSAI